MIDFYINNNDLSEKEKKIIAAAINIFSEKGFSGSSTSEIAKKAGVAEGTIFRYFKTKKDILRCISIELIKSISNSVLIKPIEKIIASEPTDLREIFRKIIVDRLKLAESLFPMARVIFTEALFHEDLKNAIFDHIIAKALAVYKIQHEKLQKEKIIRDDLSAETALKCIIGCIFIYIAQKKLFADKFANLDTEQEMEKTIDIILYGITNQQR